MGSIRSSHRTEDAFKSCEILAARISQDLNTTFSHMAIVNPSDSVDEYADDERKAPLPLFVSFSSLKMLVYSETAVFKPF